jgi:CheY-like chemotaxis protein
MRTLGGRVIVGFGLMSPNLNNLTIIVVEDDNDVRRHVGAFLDHSGAKVVVARNGLEGLEAIKINHPHMVLSDIKMLAMDGFGLLREIRALGPNAGGSVPVIAMTAFVGQGERAYLLDWFHLTMRLTVLSQTAKGLPERLGEEEDKYELQHRRGQGSGADQVVPMARQCVSRVE